MNIFLIVFPFVLSATIVAIRVWRKIKEHKLAIGMAQPRSAHAGYLLI